MSKQHCAPTEHNYQAINEPSPSGYWYLNTYTYRTMLYCTKCGHHFFVKQSVQKPITFTTTYDNPAPAASTTVDWANNNTNAPTPSGTFTWGSPIRWSAFSVTTTLLCTNPPTSTAQLTFTSLRT